MVVNLNKFDKLFAKYEQTDDIRAILDDITSLTPRVDRDRRLIELEAAFARLVPKVDLYRIEDGIREAYELNIVRILPKYDKALFSKSYIPEAVKELNRIGAVSRGFFNDYDYNIAENLLELKISFNNGGVDLLYTAKTNEILSNIIYNEFGLRFDVKITREQPEVTQDYFQNEIAELELRARKTVKEIEQHRSRQIEEAVPVEDPYKDFDRIATLSEGDVVNKQDGKIFRVGGKIFDTSEPESNSRLPM